MADTVIGFKFADESYFDAPVKKEYWDRIQSGKEGNFYLQRLAGQLASENNIALTSYQVTEVKEGGYTSGAKLRQLHVPIQQNENAEEKNGENQWAHGAILLLMDTYAKHKQQFAIPTMKKIEVWKRIASEMAASGFHFAPAAIEKKWSNMKIRYKAIVDSNKKTGQGRTRWNYYSRMAEILEGDPSVIPPVTISSLGGVKVSTLSEITNTQQCATPPKEQKHQRKSMETPVCRKRKRPNYESSEQLQSCHIRNLAMQEEIMAEERQRTELDRQRLEFMRNTEIERTELMRTMETQRTELDRPRTELDRQRTEFMRTIETQRTELLEKLVKHLMKS
ncbi:uncharacterized protein LOC112555376 isoform X2 [Pomacea canaliculata]|uniref:uncharacterized protein LOC112555376 isoform X2 n=1 Tax=Pomacea canaliculata TaxID=400727 RepID=UPI000D739882|nr:uncharacterized protein LOC112555376 isoform X2 [Pomacea canaliculata]